MGKSLSGYGQAFELRVSRSRAEKLLAPHPLPRMGYETVIVGNRDEYGFQRELVVQNVSGFYVVASHNVYRANWREVFGIEV